jgi:hypothetical protein
VLEEAAVTIVMGLDRHRAQVTADWLDTETGEVSRARVMPADRAGVRQFLARFAGQQLARMYEAESGTSGPDSSPDSMPTTVRRQARM